MVWRGGPMPPHYRIFEPSKAWSYNHIAFGDIAFGAESAQAFYFAQRLAIDGAKS
jgi:hypothetical protein